MPNGSLALRPNPNGARRTSDILEPASHRVGDLTPGTLSRCRADGASSAQRHRVQLTPAFQTLVLNFRVFLRYVGSSTIEERGGHRNVQIGAKPGIFFALHRLAISRLSISRRNSGDTGVEIKIRC
jgi:hypothetical protein